MRYVLAIASLVLSAVLLVLGIGQRTFLAGPAEITHSVKTTGDVGYAVVDADELDKVPGQANIVVQGKDAFVATAASRDVEGWVAPYEHVRVAVDRDKDRAETESVPADADAESAEEEAGAGDLSTLDPRGSDLWLEERSIDDAGSGVETETLRVPVALRDDQAVLIASDGQEPIPSEVSLVWTQDRKTPWAGPLLVAGGIFAVFGGIMYLLAIDHNRRGLGPRRGRRGPLQGIRNAFSGRRKTKLASTETSRGSGTSSRISSDRRRSRWIAVPVLGLTAALGLAGCSPSYWPDFGGNEKPTAQKTETPQSSVAPVPVTEGQLERIIERVAKVADEGDESLDANALDSRFTDDALAQRTANYKIRAAVPDYANVPPKITAEQFDYQLVQSTESWPRTLFVTVKSEDAKADGEESGDDETASPSLALVLRQESPHVNYVVSRVIALSGGISMPQAAPAEEGTALLANDIETLALPPGDLAGAFATVLQDGTGSPQAEAFDAESISHLVENMGGAQAAKLQKESDDEGQTVKFSSAVRAGDTPATALSTGVGGALVATTVIEEQTADRAGGRYKVTATGPVAALSGLEGQQDRLVTEISHQLLFFIPSQEAKTKIQLLGVTSEYVGARS